MKYLSAFVLIASLAAQASTKKPNKGEQNKLLASLRTGGNAGNSNTPPGLNGAVPPGQAVAAAAVTKDERKEAQQLAKEQKQAQKPGNNGVQSKKQNVFLTQEQCDAAVAQCTLIDPTNPEYRSGSGQTSILNDPTQKTKKTNSQYRAVLNRLKNDIVTLINAVIADPELTSLPSVCVDLVGPQTPEPGSEPTGTATGTQDNTAADEPTEGAQDPNNGNNAGSPSTGSSNAQNPSGPSDPQGPAGTNSNQGTNPGEPSNPVPKTLPPVCVVSEWSEWSSLIGFGQQDRTREVIQPGVDCPYNLSEWRQVNNTGSGNGTTPNDFEILETVSENFQNDFIRPSEGKPRDILLILDSSASINDTDFERMKEGVKVLIDSLCGGFGTEPTNNRLAIIQFSTDRVGVHSFNNDQDPDYLKSVVDGMSPLYGVTCTGWALDLAFTAFSAKYGARDYAVHDTLLITDGQSNCNEDLVWEAKELQQRSNVYALGIGVGNNQGAAQEIQSVVSNENPRHLFSLANFKNFLDMVKLVSQQVTPDMCQPVDIN